MCLKPETQTSERASERDRSTNRQTDKTRTHVEMALHPQSQNGPEMRVIHVRVHPEQPFQDGLDDRYEILRELAADAPREQRRIVQLLFDVVEERVDVARRGQLDRVLDLDAIGPQVFVVWPRVHHWTLFVVAEGPVEDRVEDRGGVIEEHCVHGEPLVLVLAPGELHGLFDRAGAERRLEVLPERAGTSPDVHRLDAPNGPGAVPRKVEERRHP